jgi:hypothetical protein
VDACSHAESGTETHPAADTLASLLELVATLMGYSDLPMDTHAMCGLVFVLLVILLDGKGEGWHKVCYVSPLNSTSNSTEQIHSEADNSLVSYKFCCLY